jgi:hypothetical protein
MTTYAWLGENGDWDVSTDWSPVGTPSSNDSASVTASGVYTVSIAQSGEDDVVGNLTTSSGATVAIGGENSLAVNNSFDNAGTITVAAGGLLTLTYEIAGHLANLGDLNSGALNLSAGARVIVESLGFSNIGTISVADGAALAFDDELPTAQVGTLETNAGANLFFSHLDNEGATLDLGVGATLSGSIYDGAMRADTITVSSVLTMFDGVSFMSADGASAMSIHNSGALDFFDTNGSTTVTVDNVDITGSGSIAGDVIFEAGTALSFVGAAATIGGAFTDKGSVSVAADGVLGLGSDTARNGEYVFEGAISGAGTVDLDFGTAVIADAADVTIAALALNGYGVALDVDEALVYAGAFSQLGGSTLSIGAGDGLSLTGTASLSGEIDGDALDIGGAASIKTGASIDVASWSVVGADANVMFDASLTYAGVFVESGATLALDGGNLDLTGGAVFSGGLVDGSRYLVTSGATSVSGLQIGGDAVWVNTGTATQAGIVTLGDESASDAILYNTSLGTYEIDDGSAIETESANVYVNNGGLFEKTGGSGYAEVAANMYNSGEIEVASGVLNFAGELWGPGRIVVEAGGTLQFGYAVGGAASTTIDVNSALTLEAGATLALGAKNLTLTAAADFAGGVVEGADRLTTDAATAVSGFTIGGSSVWFNDATATESGGGLTLGDSAGASSILYNAAAGIYDIADNSGVALGTSASSYINNAGLFAKTGGTGTSLVAANMYSAGTIEAASGTLDFQAALWGPGTSKVDAGATLEVDGVVGGASILAFHGSGGAVALDDLHAGGVDLFHGSIQGFAADDTIDAGAYGIGTSALFTENGAGTGGALTLTNGGATASITMTGVYTTANFTPTSDGHGGTLLTFHA